MCLTVSVFSANQMFVLKHDTVKFSIVVDNCFHRIHSNKCAATETAVCSLSMPKQDTETYLL